MLTIAFIHPDGRVEGVEAQADQSAMRAAIDNSILGIVGECGGNAMCATCHVYVDVGWLDRLPAMSDEERRSPGRRGSSTQAKQPLVLSDQNDAATRRGDPSSSERSSLRRRHGFPN
jgi:ferredoxin